MPRAASIPIPPNLPIALGSASAPGAASGRPSTPGSSVHAPGWKASSDPFESADEDSWVFGKWRAERAFVLVPAQQYVGQFLNTFKEFPPSQKSGSFSLDDVMKSLPRGASDK
jgi:hypothetical protein